MVQAVAPIAKTAATAVTVAGAEGLPVTINIATTAIPAAEALQATASGATETARAGVMATEVGTKAVEAAPEAVEAATKIDFALVQGAAAPETAMKNLAATGTPEAAKVQLAAEAVTEDTKLADMKFVELQKAVQPQMVEWEKSHLPGDDIQGWIDSRTAAERQFTVAEGVKRDVAEWTLKNPQGKDESPEKYAGRMEQRMRESQQAQEKLYDQMMAEQEEKRQGMSREEFMRRYAELLQKRAIADTLAMRLQKLRMSPHQTTMRKEVLTRAEAQLEDMRVDIATRETELQFDAINSRSLWKQYIVPVAVGVAMAAGPVGAAANET